MITVNSAREYADTGKTTILRKSPAYFLYSCLNRTSVYIKFYAVDFYYMEGLSGTHAFTAEGSDQAHCSGQEPQKSCH